MKELMEMKPYIGINPFTLKAIQSVSMQMTMMKTHKKTKTKKSFFTCRNSCYIGHRKALKQPRNIGKSGREGSLL